MRSVLAILLVGCFHRGHTEAELADDDEDPRIADARCCMGAKAWEASESGWGSPKAEDFLLEPGKYEKISFSAIKGMTYRFEACGDASVRELDLILYDKEGKELLRDEQEGREPIFTWTAPSSGARYLVVYLRETAGGAPGGVSQYAFTYDPD